MTKKSITTNSILNNISKVIIAIILLIAVSALWWNKRNVSTKTPLSNDNNIISGSFDEIKFKTDEEWKQLLTKEQYHIVRERGTERPFTGELLHNEEKGTYVSVGCNEPVFHSDAKFDSGTGWPSFTAPIYEDAVVLRKDVTLGVERIEVLDKCGGHLGHVFDDGPAPTGKRYCINSLALQFIPDNNR